MQRPAKVLLRSYAVRLHIGIDASTGSSEHSFPVAGIGTKQAILSYSQPAVRNRTKIPDNDEELWTGQTSIELQAADEQKVLLATAERAANSRLGR
jgi:hypothetical protein